MDNIIKNSTCMSVASVPCAVPALGLCCYKDSNIGYTFHHCKNTWGKCFDSELSSNLKTLNCLYLMIHDLSRPRFIAQGSNTFGNCHFLRRYKSKPLVTHSFIYTFIHSHHKHQIHQEHFWWIYKVKHNLPAENWMEKANPQTIVRKKDNDVN